MTAEALKTKNASGEVSTIEHDDSRGGEKVPFGRKHRDPLYVVCDLTGTYLSFPVGRPEPIGE